MHAAGPAKRPPRVVTRSKSGAGAVPRARPHSNPRRDGRHKSSSEPSPPSSPELSAGHAMYPPSPHHHHHHQYHHQPGQHGHHHQQHQHQGRRQQPRARQDQQHQQQQQQQQHQQPPLSPQHLDTVRYLSQTWRTVQEECDQSRAAGGDASSMYYQEPAPHPALQDFKPFDLEAFWGQQLYKRLTRGNS